MTPATLRLVEARDRLSQVEIQQARLAKALEQAKAQLARAEAALNQCEADYKSASVKLEEAFQAFLDERYGEQQQAAGQE